MCVGPIPDAWAPGICLASLEGFLTNGPPTTSIRDAGKDFFPLPSIQDVIGRKDPESMEFKFDMGLLFFASGYRFDNNARPVYEYWESLPDRESSRELTFEQVARSKASEQLRLVIDHVQFEAGEIPSSNWAYILKATVALKTPSQQTRADFLYGPAAPLVQSGYTQVASSTDKKESGGSALWLVGGALAGFFLLSR
jgi:hypothetical protein